MKIELTGHELSQILWLRSQLHEEDTGAFECPVYEVVQRSRVGVPETFLTAFMARQFVEHHPLRHLLVVTPREAKDNAEVRFLREFFMAKRWSEYAAPIAPSVHQVHSVQQTKDPIENVTRGNPVDPPPGLEQLRTTSRNPAAGESSRKSRPGA
jgi:hypothetical protein